MDFASFNWSQRRDTRSIFLLTSQMKDYARVGTSLFWQRQMIYAAALGLEAYYYSWQLALLNLALMIISEIYDFACFRKVLRMNARDIKSARKYIKLIYLGTAISAANICIYALTVAILQGHTTHFLSMFMLFAAALFASMNNHQLIPILIFRLAIYGATFLFIPIYDIWATNAPVTSDLWMQLFTSLFVMFFIIDCSRVSSGLYRRTLQQMADLQTEHEKTKEASAAKSEFLATVSHELRTPLTSIKGSLDLIAARALGEIPPKMEPILTIAQRNSTRLNALINDLLDLQKMEAGRMDYFMEELNAAEFLEQSIATNEPFAQRFDVTFELEPTPANLFITCDASRLDQVLSNILSNAAKFSETGSTVSIRSDVVGAMLRVSVIDRGVGLPENVKQKVFDEFSQLDSSDKRKVGGTGLGMNISKRIMEAHDGRIDYVKNEGPGTTFFIELPLANVGKSAEMPPARGRNLRLSA
ncbi:two-component hybrid sensor and regulator [Roseovarius nubinhibens ISM]|uniref:histidine kinase n=4 Tax=Roseovarius nubinhibens TaxID=314263 RepID=A3SJ44_ROSNI|nr:two-component hybrid sensor and regulator [Roseovarius nubinhibens ISM]